MIKIHLGCGKRNFGKDWIHVDAAIFPHVESHDILLSNFKREVDVIYACHLIEYFDRDEVTDLLYNWRAALKENGILRIAVPDFHQMALLYTEGKIELKDILGPLYGKWSINGKPAYHKTCYDYESLYELLESVGLEDINVYDWRKTDHAQYDDHSQAYLNPKADKENGTLISLNIECRK